MRDELLVSVVIVEAIIALCFWWMLRVRLRNEKLSNETQRRIIDDVEYGEHNMKTIEISDEDRDTVFGVLMTHATMQDMSAGHSLGIATRLGIDEPEDEDAREMIGRLDDQANDLEEDSNDLRRIAKIFGEGCD